MLDWFNDRGDYTAIFTQNATAALKQVGESYPFCAGGRLLLTVDNHNSVNGIREFALARARSWTYAPLTYARAAHRSRRRSSALLGAGRRPRRDSVRVSRAVEFLRREASARSRRTRRTTAGGTCCSMRRRSCRRTASICEAVQPDFVSVSFYKMFGYPTGVGCLLVRRSVAGAAAPAVVCGRHRELRHGAGARAHPRARRSRVRGRHAQLPRRFRRWRSACGISQSIGIDAIAHARALPDRLAAAAAARPAAQQRPADGADLRAGDHRDARRRGHDELLRSRTATCSTTGASRSWRAQERHLAAHRMLLQSRRGRDRRRAHRGRHGGGARRRTPT